MEVNLNEERISLETKLLEEGKRAGQLSHHEKHRSRVSDRVHFIVTSVLAMVVVLLVCVIMFDESDRDCESSTNLHSVYTTSLSNAKYVDMTHAYSPSSPVWPGFAGDTTFGPATAASTVDGFTVAGEAFTYNFQGFVASAYQMPTDQFVTQLDPPAHWNEFGATISDLPATFSVRPLVVIDIHEQALENPGYVATVEDVMKWEEQYGRVPKGSVVFFRCDWSLGWESYITDGLPEVFPGVSTAVLKFLHLERGILMHGHEPLDTDMTPTLEAEAWLMHNNFAQAEGVTNLHLVPPVGALVSIGFPRAEGGTGGFARYIAICPSDWEYGETVDSASGAPLPTQVAPLRRGPDGVMRPNETATPTVYCDSFNNGYHPVGCNGSVPVWLEGV